MLAPAAAGPALELVKVIHLSFCFSFIGKFLLLLFFAFHAAIRCLLAVSALIPMAQMKPSSSRPTAVTILRWAEQSRLRTTARLTNLLAVFCILSWRVFWLTMVHRVTQEAGPELIFTDLELRILDKLVHDKPAVQPLPPALSRYLIKLARLGGYLARNSDPPPGNETIWRALSRLVDIQLGVAIGGQLMGN